MSPSSNLKSEPHFGKRLRGSLAASAGVALASFGLVLNTAQGASCCGGSFAAPSIINGDDQAQLTASYGFNEVKVDSVDSDGMWHVSNNHQNTQTLKLEGARIFSDAWQAGFSLPVVTRTAPGRGSSSGLGDISTDVAYEYLSDWDYNPYRPKGIGFLALTIPTGLSRAESESGGRDSRGAGFLALGLGTLLTKALGRWDFLTSLDLHRSFEKSIATSQLQGRLQPGYGGNLALGAGYSFLPSWRLGSSLTWTYEDAISLNSASGIGDRITVINGLERYATATLSLSHSHGTDWAETITYSDQTLFGSPVNTRLGRGIMAYLQRRWPR